MIIDAIQSNATILAACQAADYVLAATLFAANSVERTDSTLRTTTWLINTFDTVTDMPSDTTEADVIIAGFKTSPLARAQAALDSMNGAGVDLSTTLMQKLITNVAASAAWSTNLRNRLKRKGSWQIAPWEQNFLSAPPTSAEIQTAWVNHTTTTTLAQDWASAQNVHINPNVYDRAALVAGLRAAANAVEGI